MGKNTYNDMAKRPPAFFEKLILVAFPGQATVDQGPELQCLLKVKVDLNSRTYLNFTKSALQSLSLS